jgi:hypothetical protein
MLTGGRGIGRCRFNRLLQNMPMGPEEIGRLTTAYEQALRAIGVVDKGDPLAELLARKIIEVAQTGIGEPADISAQAIKEIDIASSQKLAKSKGRLGGLTTKEGVPAAAETFQGVASHGGEVRHHFNPPLPKCVRAGARHASRVVPTSLTALLHRTCRPLGLLRHVAHLGGFFGHYRVVEGAAGAGAVDDVSVVVIEPTVVPALSATRRPLHGAQTAQWVSRPGGTGRKYYPAALV